MIFVTLAGFAQRQSRARASALAEIAVGAEKMAGSTWCSGQALPEFGPGPELQRP